MFQESMVMSSKAKESLFAITEEDEGQKKITYEELELALQVLSLFIKFFSLVFVTALYLKQKRASLSEYK